MWEWVPRPIEDTPIAGSPAPGRKPPEALDILTFNIGYGGLGREADFFMDGGSQVRPPNPEVVQRNLTGVVQALAARPVDIALLQEVDCASSRSFGRDQPRVLVRAFPGYAYARALNFKVAWLPYPPRQPLGRVESGLLSLCAYPLLGATRYGLPNGQPWPIRVFHLKRCLHLLCLKAADGRDFAIVHLHLSTFDDDGRMRRRELAFLRDLLLRLADSGQHVIAGGDWNHGFPGVERAPFHLPARKPSWFRTLPDGWAPPGWRFGFDPRTPSLRATDRPYAPGQTFVTIVDGFLVSPELEILRVETRDLGFAHSDHHPVHLRVALR